MRTGRKCKAMPEGLIQGTGRVKREHFCVCLMLVSAQPAPAPLPDLTLLVQVPSAHGWWPRSTSRGRVLPAAAAAAAAACQCDGSSRAAAATTAKLRQATKILRAGAKVTLSKPFRRWPRRNNPKDPPGCRTIQSLFV